MTDKIRQTKLHFSEVYKSLKHDRFYDDMTGKVLKIFPNSSMDRYNIDDTDQMAAERYLSEKNPMTLNP